ncbi:acetyl-CoA carboxylase biotin carboxyl carrier protein subunit, partial [Bifidobacterium pseudolongum]
AGQPASVAGAAAAEDTARTASERFVIEVNNRRVELIVPLDVVANLTGGTHARAAQLPTQPLRGQGMHHVERKEARDERPGVISAPMQAIVTRITVAPGQAVAKGDLLVVLESMKMENYVYAPAGGTVTEIFAAPATGVEAGETLLTMDVAGLRHGGDAHHAPAAESAQSEEAHA